jgi:phenylacetate-CoA ligase
MEVKDWMVGITLVSPFVHDDSDIKKAVDLMVRKKPAFVFGYAHSIHLLASYMVRNGLHAGPGWPKAVCFTSEMLLECERRVIEDAMNAPLLCEYGSCESGVIAYMCPEGTLHTSDDIMAIEILSGNNCVERGVVGEVVVTNLLSYEYPLIRYRQGDLAALGNEPCQCGVGLGRMTELLGRMNDRFLSPSGGIIDFIVFDKAMKEQTAIRRFKVVERACGQLEILCEVYHGQRLVYGDQNRFIEQCSRLLPPDVRVSMRIVDKLPVEPSGKFRIMIPKEEAAVYL